MNPIALAERRLHYLDTRQRVLAQNIANADTPGFRPSDTRPFAETLSRAGTPGLATTNAQHIPSPGGRGRADVQLDRQLVERTPDGNAVSIEEQVLKVANTDTAHSLAISLHRRFLTMFRTALGRTG